MKANLMKLFKKRIVALVLTFVMVIGSLPTYALSETTEEYIYLYADEIFSLADSTRESGLAVLLELFNSTDDTEALAKVYVETFSSALTSSETLAERFEIAVYSAEIIARYTKEYADEYDDDAIGDLDDLIDYISDDDYDDFCELIIAVAEEYPDMVTEMKEAGATADVIVDSYDQFETIFDYMTVLKSLFKDDENGLDPIYDATEEYGDLTVDEDNVADLVDTFNNVKSGDDVEYSEALDGVETLADFYNDTDSSSDIREELYDFLDTYYLITLATSTTDTSEDDSSSGSSGSSSSSSTTTTTTTEVVIDLLDGILPEGVGTLEDSTYVTAVVAAIGTSSEEEILAIVDSIVTTYTAETTTLSNDNSVNALTIINAALDSVSSSENKLTLLGNVNLVLDTYVSGIQNGLIVADLFNTEVTEDLSYVDMATKTMEVTGNITNSIYTGYSTAVTDNSTILANLLNIYNLLDDTDKLTFIDEMPSLLASLTKITTTEEEAIAVLEQINAYYQFASADSREAFDISYLLSVMANEVVENQATVINLNTDTIVLADMFESLGKAMTSSDTIVDAFATNNISLDRVAETPVCVYTSTDSLSEMSVTVNQSDLDTVFAAGADYVKIDSALGFIKVVPDMLADAAEELTFTITKSGEFSLVADGEEVNELNKSVELSRVFYSQDQAVIDSLIAMYTADGESMTTPVKYNKAYYGIVFKTDTLANFIIRSNSVAFDDTDEASWAADYINYLGAKGIVDSEDGNVRPQDNITRAEFVAYLVRAFKLANTDTELPFTDISEDDWYYSEVAAAYASGLINGKTETAFAPNDYITREEIFKILGELMADNGVVNNLATINFTDIDEISSWAIDGTKYVVQEGVVGGYTDNTIKPDNNTTRAEAMKMIYYVYNR